MKVKELVVMLMVVFNEEEERKKRDNKSEWIFKRYLQRYGYLFSDSRNKNK